MKKKYFILTAFILILFAVSCKTPSAPVEDEEISHTLETVGFDRTLEIVTWNMHNFPDNGDKSVDSYEIIINNIDVDLYAVQEIADTYAFDRLMGKLNEYDGVYSDDTYGTGYQKTGIIYRKKLISVLSKEQIFTDREYEFPRPPLVLGLKVTKEGFEYDLFLVVIHLKAYSGTEELERRRGAVRLLKEYMDGRISAGPEKDYIIAGDWNDELTDPESENCFTLLLNDPEDYLFLTLDIAEDPASVSYPGSGSLIDHILISRALFDEYSGGETRVLVIDNRIDAYFSNVSDHRPVISFFPVFSD